IEFYKRFEAARDPDGVLALAAEMRDRFGTPSAAAESFVELEKIRTLSGMIGFESVFQEKDGTVRMVTGENFRAPVQHVVRVVSARSDLAILPGERQRPHFKPAK